MSLGAKAANEKWTKARTYTVGLLGWEHLAGQLCGVCRRSFHDGDVVAKGRVGNFAHLNCAKATARVDRPSRYAELCETCHRPETTTHPLIFNTRSQQVHAHGCPPRPR